MRTLNPYGVAPASKPCALPLAFFKSPIERRSLLTGYDAVIGSSCMHRPRPLHCLWALSDRGWSFLRGADSSRPGRTPAFKPKRHLIKLGIDRRYNNLTDILPRDWRPNCGLLFCTQKHHTLLQATRCQGCQSLCRAQRFRHDVTI